MPPLLTLVEDARPLNLLSARGPLRRWVADPPARASRRATFDSLIPMRNGHSRFLTNRLLRAENEEVSALSQLASVGGSVDPQRRGPRARKRLNGPDSRKSHE